MRKYQPLWIQLKSLKVLTIQLEPADITVEQARAQFRTFKKAMSKEKYHDIHFRSDYPTSKINYVLETKVRRITMSLELDTKITAELF